MAKKKFNRPQSRRHDTSWEPVAEWYMGWVGNKGSKHHRTLAIPAVLELVGDCRGERVLEIGCGHGILAPHIVGAGGHYTGVDISPTLIGQARRKGGRAARFLIGDARSLQKIEGLEPGGFDVAVFMLSIQDMEPLSAVLRAAAWAVKVGGRVIILMVHPCFRVPRQSGWGWDGNRKLQFRRIDRYLTPLQVSRGPQSGKLQGATRSFHRPLSAYVNELAQAGFLLEQMVEIPGYAAEDTPGRRRSEPRDNQDIPLFLGVRAYRQSTRQARE